MATPTQQLLDIKLGGDGALRAFVAERRPDRAWRLIARDLFDETKIDVTYESLRAWFPELAEVK